MRAFLTLLFEQAGQIFVVALAAAMTLVAVVMYVSA